MASAKTGVHVMQLKKVQVPARLQRGDKFIRIEDVFEAANPNQITLKVDARGFFLQIESENANVENELIDIALVRDTRTGKQVKLPRDNKGKEASNLGSPKIQLDRTFTIVWGSEFANVNFINFTCDNKETAQFWTEHVGKIAHNLLAVNSSTYDFLLKSHTRIVLMADREGRISTKNVIKTFAQHKEDKKRVESALELCGLPTGKNETFPAEKFTEELFFTFYKHLVVRKEVFKIFQKFVGNDSKDQLISSKKGKHAHEFKLSLLTGLKEDRHQSEEKLMTVDQFVNFLNKEQRDPRLNEILYPYIDRAKGKEIINQFEPNSANAQKSMLSIDGFLKYLMSEDNAIIPPEKLDLNADMDQPLNHYFINSSHNTYLAGHQFTGKSSVEIYRQCLLAGCRCVELDCWNGRNSDEPIVTHGFTMVTDILLKEVLEAIAECAFKTSDYPVILSLENHCSPKQQAKIAAYCRKIFGDMLLTDPLPSHPLKSGFPLPSPNQLLHKIIIKNKKRHHTRREKKRATAGNSPIETVSNSLSSGNGNSLNKQQISTVLAGTLPSQISDVTQTIGTPERKLLRSLANTTNSSEESNTQEGSSGGGNQAANSVTLVQPNSQLQSVTTSNSNSTVLSQSTKVTSSAVPVDNALNNCELEDESDTSIDEDEGGPSSDAGNTSIVLSLATTNQQTVTSNLACVPPAQISTPQQPKTAHIKESEAAEELSALVNYIEAAPFHSFEYAEKRNRSYEISSFSETQATNLLKERPVDFVNFNKRQLSRIYPRGTRLESSNYNPQLFFNAGCQMVALNYQTLDLGMQLNLGIFEYNGRSGYLLKPDFMRRADRKFDPFCESIVDGIIAGMVSIQVLSGQLLSAEKRCGTYVEVDMFGLPADTSRRKRTRIVANNTLNPIYLSNDQELTFEFSKVRLPDLASIRLAAYEENGKLIGHRILPVVGLRPGYRHISLRNEIGQPLNYASLFVHIEVQDYVPHKLSALAEALANPIAYQSMIEKRSKQLEALTDEESNRERAENEATEIEIEAENLFNNITGTGKSFLQFDSKDDSNKENQEKRPGDDEHDQTDANTANGNVTSLTRRMKSVRNFFASSSTGGTATSSTQQPQQSISTGLAVAANAAIGAPNTVTGLMSSSIINQTPATAGSLVSNSANAPVSGLAASSNIATDTGGLTGGLTSNVQANLLQRQDTQTNLGIANQSTKTTTTDTTASNYLDLSDMPSVLESQEVINQEAESLAKLCEHKRVVKVQREMDRELKGLRKKHNKQLGKEISAMNQKRDKLMACQTKQRSLLAKTHSKLSRKSVSSDKNWESVGHSSEQLNDIGVCVDPSKPSNPSEPGFLQEQVPTSESAENLCTPSTNQNPITTSTLISQFQKKSYKSVSLLSRRRQSLQFPSFRSNLMKRQSEQNLQTNIAENQAKLDDLHRTTAETIMALIREQMRVEQETFERFHKKLFSALKKTMVNSQNEQLDRLQSLHDNEVQLLMDRLNCQSKESIANFASAHKDKNEFARVKRELQQRLIVLAVSERQRFELMLEKRRTELIAKQEQIKIDLTQFKEAQYQEKHGEFLNRLQHFQTSSEQKDLQQFLDLVGQNCSRSSSARSSFTMSSGIFSSLTGCSSNSMDQQRRSGSSSGLLPMVLDHAGNNGNKRRSLINLQHNSSCENSQDGRISAGANTAVIVEPSIDQTNRNKHSSAPDLDLDKASGASIEQQTIMNRIQEEWPTSKLPEMTESNDGHVREKRHASRSKKRSPSRTREQH